MSTEVTVALIVAAGGIATTVVTVGLNRVFGGARRDRIDAEARVAELWREWSEEQGERIGDLEKRVKSLEDDLKDEREKNSRQAMLMTALIRWALLLRDEVIRLGGHIPPPPPEVEAALTTLNP